MTALYNRFWLVYATAFQSIAILVHMAFLLAPRVLYRAYFVESFAIGYLILGAIMGGVLIESAAPVRRTRRAPAPPPSGP
jgi:hypothetical protein